MKAYVLEGIGELLFQEVKTPVLKAGEVLVEVRAAGICGSDLPRIFQTGTYHFPTIPGHEFSGKVVEAYGEEERAWVGRRVGVFPLIPCGTCFTCKEEQYEMCRSYNYLGSRCDGGFAEFVAVPVWNLIELPEQTSYEEAAMLEPASVALHAVRKLDLTKKESAALFGLGTIGSIIVQWLSLNGIENVIATGHRQEFGEVMRRTANPSYRYFNANSGDAVPWIMSQTNQMGVDIAIDCIGSETSLTDCLKSVRPGGQILIVGNPKGDLNLPKDVYWQLLRKQITVRGTWNSLFLHRPDDDWNTVLSSCARGDLHLAELITHRLSFEHLQEGLDIMRQKQVYRNKVMICKTKYM